MIEVEQVDFVTVPTRDVLGFVEDPDGNALMLHRSYVSKVPRGQG